MQITRVRVWLLVMFALALPVGSWAEVRVYFSPRGGCDQALVNLAHSATKYVDAACYTFTLDSIADQLMAAKQRGVRVRVIVDRTQGVQQSSKVAKLSRAGIQVKLNSHSGLMHDKFLVVDGKNVATGSFNWTRAAIEKNDENLVVFRAEPTVAATFEGQFQKMWGDQARFSAYRATGSSSFRRASSPAGPGITAPKENRPSAASEKDIVYITKSGRKYHRAGCSYLGRSSIPISRREAEARGYLPCSRCKP